jgi:hypothetical protein
MPAMTATAKRPLLDFATLLSCDTQGSEPGAFAPDGVYRAAAFLRQQ